MSNDRRPDALFGLAIASNETFMFSV